MELYTETPLGKAILKAFEELSEEVADNIKDAAPGFCKAYVFGGAALHIYTNARGSSDIDTELEAAEKLEVDEIIVTYIDEDGSEQSVEIDPNFNTGISGMLAEGYREDAIPLATAADSPLHVFLVSPIHLAVHKLDRLAGDDQNDIMSLAEKGRITAEELRDVGYEVASYGIGGADRLKSNVQFMYEKLKEQGY